MGKLGQNLRNLAIEAKADESKVIGRHRRSETISDKVHRTGHNAAKHCVHLVLLTSAGLPAILMFEAFRPLWAKYIESPLSDIMVGSGAEAAQHAISAFLNI